MKESVAAGAARKAAVVTDNKEANTATRDTVDSRVGKDMVDMANRDTVDTRVDKVMADSKVDGVNTKDMVNSVVMDSKVTEVSKVDGVNKVDRDMADSKADGDNMKGMVNNVVDMDNKSTADTGSNMKVNMVQTGIMAEADMMKMKMNPACRGVTRVNRKKIMMKNTTKMMMTIMVCKASMERKKMMNMMKTRMKMTTVK
jgi:hypothetical protein